MEDENGKNISNERDEEERSNSHDRHARVPNIQNVRIVNIPNIQNLNIGSTYSFNQPTTFTHPSNSLLQGAVGNFIFIQNFQTCDEDSDTSSSSSSEAPRSVRDEEWFQKCLYQVRRRYNTRFAYMRSFFWKGKGYDYPISDYWVDPELEEVIGYWQEYKNVPIEKLFEETKQSGYKVILITGNPGFGKTSVAKKIAFDWASLSKPHYLDHFELLVVFPLIKLRGRTVTRAIIDTIFEIAKVEPPFESETTDLKILFILDGFEETDDSENILNFINRDAIKISSNITVVLTSRPYCFNDIKVEINHHFRIVPFSKKNQFQYVKETFHSEKVKRLSLIQKLNEDIFISGLGSSVLFLHILSCMHHDYNLNGKIRKTDVFIEIFNRLLYRYRMKYEENPVLPEGESYILTNEILQKFGQLAWQNLMKKKPITSEYLYQFFPDEDEYKMALHLDILNSSPVMIRKKKVVLFHFLHPSFCEFLAALHIISLDIKYNLFAILATNDEFTHPNGNKYNYTSCFSFNYGTYYLFLLGLMKEKKSLATFIRSRFDKNIGCLQHNMFSSLEILHKEVYLTAWKAYCSKLKSITFNAGRDNIRVFKSIIDCGYIEYININLPSPGPRLQICKDDIIEILQNSKLLFIVEIRVKISEEPERTCFEKLGDSITVYSDIRQSVNIWMEFVLKLKPLNPYLWFQVRITSNQNSMLSEPSVISYKQRYINFGQDKRAGIAFITNVKESEQCYIGSLEILSLLLPKNTINTCIYFISYEQFGFIKKYFPWDERFKVKTGYVINRVDGFHFRIEKKCF